MMRQGTGYRKKHLSDGLRVEAGARQGRGGGAGALLLSARKA